jgi:hypothetical protein
MYFIVTESKVLRLYTHLIVWLIKIYITRSLQFIYNLQLLLGTTSSRAIVTICSVNSWHAAGPHAVAPALTHRSFATTVSQLKICDFSGEILKRLKCYNFLWVQRRHNCSPAASFANCFMTLYLFKVHLQTFLCISMTQNTRIWFVTLLSQMSDISYHTTRWCFIQRQCIFTKSHLPHAIEFSFCLLYNDVLFR